MGCPRIYDPICAVEGTEEVTYSNECEFKRHVCEFKKKAIRVIRAGPCTHESL